MQNIKIYKRIKFFTDYKPSEDMKSDIAYPTTSVTQRLTEAVKTETIYYTTEASTTNPPQKPEYKGKNKWLLV